MAAIPLGICPLSPSSSPSCFRFRLNSSRRNQQQVLCGINPQPQQPTEAAAGRRQALLSLALSTTAFLSHALPDTTTGIYWAVGAGQPSGFKSVTAFYPEEAAATSSVSVVITGLGPDESFGKVDEFAETLVSGLDRSWQRPPGVAAKLIASKSSNGIYYIEYTLQNPGESRKHLISALGIASIGWINRLYTVTGQFLEDESEKYGPKVQKVANLNMGNINPVLGASILG